jgi:hypothetical protein
VAGTRKKKRDQTIFESIRKPTAPPSKKMGEDKPEERVHPAARKTKHKKKPQPDEN